VIDMAKICQMLEIAE